MNNNPKISVVIPSLNTKEYIEECVYSAINQTIKDIEIICVDAGSNDGTLEILNSMAQADNRIKIINSEKKSYGYQMNLGLAASKGEYLAILESDDVIEEDMYETLYNIVKKHELQVLQCDFRAFVCEDGKKIFRNRFKSKDKTIYEKVLSSRDHRIFDIEILIQPGLYSIEYLRKINLKWNESPGAAFQDNGFYFQVFSQVDRLMFSRNVFYQLRRDREESSINFNGRKFDMRAEYDFIRAFLSKNESLENEFKYICAKKRFKNYQLTMRKLNDEYKLEFLGLFSNDFKLLMNNGELDRELFSEDNYKIIEEIINDFEQYYYGSIMNDARYINIDDTLRSKLSSEEYEEIRIANKEIEGLFNKRNELTNSIEAKDKEIKSLQKQIRRIDNLKWFKLHRLFFRKKLKEEK